MCWCVLSVVYGGVVCCYELFIVCWLLFVVWRVLRLACCMECVLRCALNGVCCLLFAIVCCRLFVGV